MDRTRITYKRETKRTIALRRQQTIGVLSTGASSHSLTAFLAVGTDRTKLPPFVIFKAKAWEIIEKHFTDCSELNVWPLPKQQLGRRTWYETLGTIPMQTISWKQCMQLHDIRRV